MPQTISDRLRGIGIATLALMLAGVLLAACGSSSSGSSTTANTTTAAAGAAAAQTSGRRFGEGSPLLKSTAYRTALMKFASCMKENSVNIPTPNTSGSGPIFNTEGLDTSSATYQAAKKKCNPILRSGILGRGSPAASSSKAGAGG